MATRSTPPNSNNVPTGISLGTPVHTRSSTTGFLNTKYLMRDEIYNAMSHEMSPFFLGPMPPQLFLSTFLPSSKAPSFKFKVGMFDALASLRTEALMYKVFIDIVQPYLKTLYIRDTSRSPDRATTSLSVSLSPDCTVYDQAHKNVIGANSAVSDIWIEFKSKAEEDAFLVNFPDGGQSVSSSNRLMNQGPKGVSTAGQITAYAALQLDCQFRTHVFSILVVEDYARLIRWDRSGAVVTAPIYYRRDPELLDFFIHYDQAGRQERGHDNSVRKATPEETLKAVTADDQFHITQDLFVVTIPRHTYEPESGCGNFIIKPPVCRLYTPPGRATRTSIAFDIERNSVVFFKDSWRVACDGMEREGNIYKTLNNAEIPNIPHCAASGDVGVDTYHSTCTGRFANEPWALKSTHEFTRHRHHRLILDDVGKKLNTFRCSRDMVRAVHAALVAHRDAFEKCKILHRDISPNNILLTESADFDGGLLIDWDLCKQVDPGDPSAGSARQAARTGTWQFMAADLIENPNINQTFVHDIKSAFFVLLWMALHYLHCSWGVDGLSSFVDTVFNPQVYGNTGGLTKLMFMRGDQELNKLNFTDNVPLAGLLRNLKELLSVRHRDRPTYAHKSNIKDVIHQARGIEPTSKLAAVDDQAFKSVLADYEFYMSALDNHTSAILTIKQAIDKENAWPAFEPANRQRLLLSHAVKRGLRSGSKRCREAALECEGGDLMEWQSLPK
ncbi:hypothetical protein EDB85DRAFT_2149458 [Lactarius pseudohatsudake]|nr:hypothetical protein EDB85DRAFT_2149458 [Lactarius pseudohatsudake]